MPELRYALPYISHLRVTKRPTQNFVPAGYQNKDGQDLYKQVTDLPGIECEITPYMGTVKGPATQYRFPSKTFFEEALASVIASPVTEQTLSSKSNIEATLARTDIIWAENVLMAGQLPVLKDLWATVFSDALDAFTTWREPTETVGIPLEVKEMQWDAIIPYEGTKSITLKIGLYSSQTQNPVLTMLQFEDSVARTQRLAASAQFNTRITQLTSEIAALPSGPSSTRTQKEVELERATTEKTTRDAIEIGILSELVSNPSVMVSLPNLLMAIIGTVKQLNGWDSLDMNVVQERLVINLTNIISS